MLLIGNVCSICKFRRAFRFSHFVREFDSDFGVSSWLRTLVHLLESDLRLPGRTVSGMFLNVVTAARRVRFVLNRLVHLLYWRPFVLRRAHSITLNYSKTTEHTVPATKCM